MDSQPRKAKDILAELAEAAINELRDLPRSAAQWLEKISDQSKIMWSASVDNETECGCGGRDGVAIRVPGGPDVPDRVRNMIVITAFSHHEGGKASNAFLTVEETKQLVNRIGDAIMAVEGARS